MRQPLILNRRNLGPPGAPLPPNAVYIGRYNRPFRLPRSKWRNPFKIPKDGTRDEVIAKYRAWILQQPELLAALPELGGKQLICWCAPERCHGEVLVELLDQIRPSIRPA